MLCVRGVTIFTLSAKEQRQYFEYDCEVVHEKEKQAWAYHGALRNTTAQCNGSREFSIELYSRDPPRNVCFNLPHGDIIKAELLGKIKVDNINCVAFVHHALHRFFEDQQIGETFRPKQNKQTVLNWFGYFEHLCLVR